MVKVELLSRVIVVAVVVMKRSQRHEVACGQRRVAARWFAAEVTVLFQRGERARVWHKCGWRGLSATRLGEVETGRVAGGRRCVAATKDDGGLAVGVIGQLIMAWVLISACRGRCEAVARCLGVLAEGVVGSRLGRGRPRRYHGVPTASQAMAAPCWEAVVGNRVEQR